MSYSNSNYGGTADQQGRRDSARVRPESVITINLKALRGVSVISHEGRQYVAIPLDENPTVFLGRDEISLDLNVFRKPETGRYGETHYLRASLSSRMRSTIPRDQWAGYTPIVGNLKPFEAIMSRGQGRPVQQQGRGYTQPRRDEPQRQTPPQTGYAPQTQGGFGGFPAPPVYSMDDMPEF